MAQMNSHMVQFLKEVVHDGQALDCTNNQVRFHLDTCAVGVRTMPKRNA
jgi:hypothetical protein